MNDEKKAPDCHSSAKRYSRPPNRPGSEKLVRGWGRDDRETKTKELE